MGKNEDWETAWSLEDYLFEIFEMNKFNSEEFKVLLRIYGREKIEVIWKKYREKKAELLK